MITATESEWMERFPENNNNSADTDSCNVIICSDDMYDHYGEPKTAPRNMIRFWVSPSTLLPIEIVNENDPDVTKSKLWENAIRTRDLAIHNIYNKKYASIDMGCGGWAVANPSHTDYYKNLVKSVARFITISTYGRERGCTTVRFSDYSLDMARLVLPLLLTKEESGSFQFDVKKYSSIKPIKAEITPDGRACQGCMEDFKELCELLPSLDSKVNVNVLVNTRMIQIKSESIPEWVTIMMAADLSEVVEGGERNHPLMIFLEPPSLNFSICLFGAHYSELVNFSSAYENIDKILNRMRARGMFKKADDLERDLVFEESICTPMEQLNEKASNGARDLMMHLSPQPTQDFFDIC